MSRHNKPVPISMEKNVMKKAISSAKGMRKLIWGITLSVALAFGASSGLLSATGSGVRKIYSPEFEKAVTVIKKYEGLHRNKGNVIGYGHQIIKGDKYKRGANLTESQADALLRKDLSQLCAKYRSFGKDSLILAALAYNCGIGTVAKSTVYKNLLSGNRNIKNSYLAHSKYRGKTLKQLKRRRAEEYETLFIP